jgi:hypothetical protein
MEFQQFSSKPFTKDMIWNGDLVSSEPYKFGGVFEGSGFIRTKYVLSVAGADVINIPIYNEKTPPANTIAVQIYQVSPCDEMGGEICVYYGAAYSISGFTLLFVDKNMKVLETKEISDNPTVYQIPTGTCGIYASSTASTAVAPYYATITIKGFNVEVAA